MAEISLAPHYNKLEHMTGCKNIKYDCFQACPGCFQKILASQSAYFVKLLTVSHKYVSRSEPQALQNIHYGLIKSRDEPNLPFDVAAIPSHK